MAANANPTALLVIDLQKDFFAKTTPVYEASGLIAKINGLIERARRAEVRVIFVQHGNTSFLKKGSENWQLHPEVKAQDGDVRIHKVHASSFKDPQLHRLLQMQGIKRLVVTRLVSHGCVKAACIDGRKLGYEVILVKDAHSRFCPSANRVFIDNRWLGRRTRKMLSQI